MAINGLHGLLYTSEPEKLRAMLRDVFRFKSVDAGGGWLIFGMPPAELGVHPLEGENFEAGHRHLMSFMCDDLNKTITELRAKGVNVVGEPKDEGYGITTMLHLPGGCEVMLYEPRHPIAAAIPRASRRIRTKPAAKRSRAKGSRPKKQTRRPTKRAGRRR